MQKLLSELKNFALDGLLANSDSNLTDSYSCRGMFSAIFYGIYTDS